MTRSIRERIDEGEFENRATRPNKRYFEANGWEDQYRPAMDEYWRQERLAKEKFFQAILYDVGLENHPNAQKIAEYAWGEGHSSGYYEVYNHMCEISDLFFHKGHLLERTQKDVTESVELGMDTKVWGEKT